MATANRESGVAGTVMSMITLRFPNILSFDTSVLSETDGGYYSRANIRSFVPHLCQIQWNGASARGARPRFACQSLPGRERLTRTFNPC
eukprot:3493727-Pyramimonas_sp.AAC.1